MNKIHVIARLKGKQVTPRKFLWVGRHGTIGFRWVSHVREATRFSYEEAYQQCVRFSAPGMLPDGFRVMGFIAPLREDDSDE